MNEIADFPGRGELVALIEDLLGQREAGVDNPTIVRRLGRNGWVAPHFAPEHGGPGLDRAHAVAALTLLATDLRGADALAWAEGDDAAAEWIVQFLRTRANSIEGGTSEIQRNIVGERVLGLPREPDPYKGLPWRDVPRS